jgi:hypothetical protein
MVIACDPRNLEKVCNFDETELDIFRRIQNFTFHTTLLKVKVPSDNKPQNGVIFSPNALESMLGRVYGFRNESAKTFGISVANQMDENLVTVYQLLGTSSPPLTPDEFEDILKSDLSDLAWWPYGIEYTILDSLTTPYFNHFRAEDIVSHLPWQLLDLQGTHNTLYVHATTCFESALDCWGYEKMLLAKLPADTNANILIIGAGVSGLLFALKLKKAG